MKTNKKFKKLSLITLLISSIFALNTDNLFAMAESIKDENPTTALMSSSRHKDLMAQITQVQSDKRLQQQLKRIGKLREQFLIVALKESCFRSHQIEKAFDPACKLSDLRKQVTQQTIEALKSAENEYFNADPIVQELVDQIELTAQIHHAKIIATTLKETQSQFGFQNLGERFTYTVIKDIVSKEMLSQKDHLKYLLSPDYFSNFKLMDICMPFTLSMPYFNFLNKFYNSILKKEFTFTLEMLPKTNPELLNSILYLLKQTRGYNLKLITLEKIEQFISTKKSFENTAQGSCQRKLDANKKQKLKEIKARIEQETYSLQELEHLRIMFLRESTKSLRKKVLFLIQCELENQSGKLLDKYFDYLINLKNIKAATPATDRLLTTKEINIENLSKIGIEETILGWLKEITKPKPKPATTVTGKQTARKAPNKKRGKGSGKKPIRKLGPNKNKTKPVDIDKPADTDKTKKSTPEEKVVIIFDKEILSSSAKIEQSQIEKDNLTQITQQISELTFTPEEQNTKQADIVSENCIYDLSRGIFNGHQIKLFVFEEKKDSETLLQNLDYRFLEQHGKILRTLDNNHSFSKFVEKSFGHCGIITESKELATHEIQNMTRKYNSAFNFDQYKYKITIQIPGKISGIYCSTDFANKFGPNGNFEFTILQRNPADPNPLCVHRFFRRLNCIEQPAFA